MLLKKLDTTCKRMKLGYYLIPHTKMNSKWIEDLKLRPETIELLRKTQAVSSLTSWQWFFWINTKSKNKKAGLHQTKKLPSKGNQQNENETYWMGKAPRHLRKSPNYSPCLPPAADMVWPEGCPLSPPRTPGRSQVLWRVRTLSWETPRWNFIPPCWAWDASEISNYWRRSHREGADGHLPRMLAKGLSPSFRLHLDFNFHLNLRSDPRAQGAGHQEAAFNRLRCLVWNVWSFEFVFIPIETNRKKKKF